MTSELATAFPDVSPGCSPLGSLVLVQLRSAKLKTVGGIILPEETRDAEKWNSQVGKVISVGPVAFKKRDSLTDWPEGAWVKPGDFVRVPLYGGDRWAVPIPGRPAGEEALFVLFDDLNLRAKIDGDPLAMKAYV